MIKIYKRNDLHGQIVATIPLDDKGLDDKLSFSTGKFWWRSPRAKMGLWDGKIHLYNRKSRLFPLGLIKEVKKWCENEELEYEVIDQRTSELIPYDENVTLEGITLREDQKIAINKALKRGRGIMHCAVASGKTEMAAAIIKSFNFPVTLFLVGRKKLARQARERFSLRWGCPLEDIGIIDGGKWENGRLPIYVAGIQTLISSKFDKMRKVLLENVKVLFIDEAHKASAKTFYKVIMSCKARYRYGLTGTPTGRSDGADLKLRACTGPVIAKITSKELTDKGLVAKPTIIFTRIDRPKIYLPGNEWGKIYTQGIINHPLRNKVLLNYVNELQSKDKKILVLIKEIIHGRWLEEQIPDSKFLHGSLDKEIIDDSIREFENDEIKTLIATSIFDEGCDVPCIQVVINAAGGKSPITILQRIGRGMRKKEDNRLFVFDFFDDTNSYLKLHSETRLKICKKEQFEVIELKEATKIEKFLKL
jgi:superfamily II DNA or RNA helicase